MAQLSALGAAFFAAAAAANGLPERAAGESLDDYVDKHAIDAVMRNDFARAIDAANNADQTTLAGCVHSIATYTDPRDGAIKRREKDLTPGT